MKKLNSDGPALLDGVPRPASLSAADVRSRMERGHAVVDLRDQLGFGAGHIPGAFGIGAGRNLSTWAAWVVPYDTPIILMAEDDSQIEEAVRSLVRVGLDDVQGYLPGGMRAWREAGFPEAKLPQLTPQELHERLRRGERLRTIDVRADGEWKSGHIEGATHIMGGHLADRASELRGNGPLAIVCGAGYRSTVAASVLERAGVGPLFNVTGGMTAWRAAGLPTVQS
jgi:hydroxyacylglutathione hydrolase